MVEPQLVRIVLGLEVADDAATPMSQQNRRVWLLVGVLVVLAAGVHALVLLLPTERPSGPRAPWLLMAVAFGLAEVCVVHVRWGKEAHTFGLAEIPLVLGLFLLSPVQLVLARLVGAGLALVLFRRQSLLKTAFNLAQWWLGTGIAVLLWHTTADLAAPYGQRSWWAALTATLVADVVATVAILVAMALRGMSLDLRIGWTTLLTGALPAGANACFALVTLDVLLVDARGVWALLIVAAFVAIAQRAHVGLQRRHDSLERLNEFGARIAYRLDVEAVLDEVLQGTAMLLDAAECELALTGSFAGRALVVRRTAEGVLRLEGDSGDALPAATEQLPRRWGRGGQSASLTVQVTDQGVAIGALTVRSRLGEVGAFDSDDLRVLRGLVSHVSAALVNGHLADELRQQVRENQFQALHDALTGLPNRVLFDRSVTTALTGDAPIMVLLMDLDGFKDINDTLGHAAGDQLLREIAQRLLVSAPEAQIVARLGGDEFALLLRGACRDEAREFALLLRDALLQPMAMHGITLTVDVSVGIAFAPEHGSDIHSLLRHADVAMYSAKLARSHVECYTTSLDANSSSRLALVSELRDAVSGGGLELWYQPQTDLTSGKVLSVEALVRWRHPTRGLVPPDEFIPIAEQTGLIDGLTDFVLNEAMRQCSAWAAQGLFLSVAVNVSARSLRREAFTTEVRQALTRHRVPASSLIVEITESAMMEDPKRASARLRELRASGVRISVDDFGTGYSSLSNLKHLPVDEVKIDRSFVTHMVEDSEDDAIVASIVQLVQRLGMSVVAEGVETAEVLERLTELGCNTAQGYFMSKPLEAAALRTWYCARYSNMQGALPVEAWNSYIPATRSTREVIAASHRS